MHGQGWWKAALILIPFVTLIIGLGLGFILGRFVFPVSGCNTTVTPTPTVTPTQPVQTLTDFTGHYITAKLPAGWTIVESSDFSGESVSENTYAGLARLTISHNSSNIVTLGAGIGIGGTAECDNIYRFADTNPAFIQSQIDNNSAISPDINATIIDLTTSTYTEYSFLGNTVRRVGTNLYFKDDTAINYFNVSCGLNAEYRNFTVIVFTIAGKAGTVRTYFVQQAVPSTFTAAQLLELDGVLQSIKEV